MEFTEVPEFISVVDHTYHCGYQEHAKHLLSKEWLAKCDPTNSTPYLIVNPFSR